MYDSKNYPTSADDAEAFVAGHDHGTLVVCEPDGWPQTTILPFVKEGGSILLHAVTEDPTCLALRSTERATFLVSDYLAFSPHHWVDEHNAARATLHFRAVAYECRATVDDRPEAVAEILRLLLRRYEPDATYEPIVDGEFYASRLRRLSALRLEVVRQRAKFKIGPYGPAALKSSVAANLRRRGGEADRYAATIIDSAVAGTPLPARIAPVDR